MPTHSPPKALTEALILAKCKTDTLANVRNLNLWGNHLSDVSIFQHMPQLQVLSLSINDISSLRPFAFCTHLEELYLRRNNVLDLAEVAHLRHLPKLKILWLRDNPCAENPLYRAFVIRMLPHLEKLDKTYVTPEDRTHADSLDSSSMQELLDRVAPVIRNPFSAVRPPRVAIPSEQQVRDAHAERPGTAPAHAQSTPRFMHHHSANPVPSPRVQGTNLASPPADDPADTAPPSTPITKSGRSVPVETYTTAPPSPGKAEPIFRHSPGNLSADTERDRQLSLHPRTVPLGVAANHSRLSSPRHDPSSTVHGGNDPSHARGSLPPPSPATPHNTTGTSSPSSHAPISQSTHTDQRPEAGARSSPPGAGSGAPTSLYTPARGSPLARAADGEQSGERRAEGGLRASPLSRRGGDSELPTYTTSAGGHAGAHGRNGGHTSDVNIRVAISALLRELSPASLMDVRAQCDTLLREAMGSAAREIGVRAQGDRGTSERRREGSPSHRRNGSNGVSSGQNQTDKVTDTRIPSERAGRTIQQEASSLGPAAVPSTAQTVSPRPERESHRSP